MFRAGLQFDTKNMSDELQKSFHIAFGFGPGERWFGVVAWDNPDDDDGVHGVLTLISKRMLPTHKVTVDTSLQQISLADHPSAGPIPYSVRSALHPVHWHQPLIRPSSNALAPTFDRFNTTAQASLWVAVKALAWKHDAMLVNEMRQARDSEARGSDKFRALCELPSFGSSSHADTKMSPEALSLKLDYPAEPGIHKKIDNHIFTRLLLFSAEATLKHFRRTLEGLFPGANVLQEGGFESPDYDPNALTISFAPVKGLERTLVKFDAYRLESDPGQWPVTPQIRDTLRAKLEAPNGDAFASAVSALMSEFGIREGRGRLKNNLNIEKHQPPNMLINLVVDTLGLPSITAEVQLYLRDIEKLNEVRILGSYLFSGGALYG